MLLYVVYQVTKHDLMYLRKVHVEESEENLRQFMVENPLGVLITALDMPAMASIQATHIPFVINGFSNADQDGTVLTLRGHMARANPQAQGLVQAVRGAPSAGTLTKDVMVLFNGPAHSYVPPRYYRHTKPQTQKAVPTWNYSTVQAHGRITVHHDMSREESFAFLSRQIEDLTNAQEAAAEHEDGHQWAVSDAPEAYINVLKRSIIGIEIRVSKLQGKHKMSQEMPFEDVLGVVDGFAAKGNQAMAQAVLERNSHRV